MEPTLTTSLIGIAVFTALMIVSYRAANGKLNVREEKQAAYKNWVARHGKKLKRSIAVISVLYYTGMLIQLLG